MFLLNYNGLKERSMPSLEEARRSRNQDYNNFIASENITNIQSADTIADFFYNNMDSMDFSSPNTIYGNLISAQGIVKDEGMLNNVQSIVQGALNACGNNMPYVVTERENLIDISSPNRVKDCIYSSCKLWLNVKYENYPFLAQQIMMYIARPDSVNSADPTQFRICSTAERNDIISINTDYAHAGKLIKVLKQLKKVYPNLFYSNVASNPLISTIDDVVSYADVQYNMSYPKSIANLLARINNRRDEILATKPKLMKLKIKKILLEIMIEDAMELKTNQNFNKAYLINPANMSSVRSSKGIPCQDLTAQEIDEEIQNIQANISEVNEQANKIDKKFIRLFFR